VNPDNNPSADAGATETFKSPTEMFKGRLVQLLFECITHQSNCYNDKNEVYTFARKTWNLSILLERYTPSSKRKELIDLKKQLKDEIKTVREDKEKKYETPGDIADQISNLEYLYAEEVHDHNKRILINSPLIEIDIEGELDLTDDKTLELIRIGSKKDDAELVFKQ
jgi:hypothetical protein